MTDSKNLVTNYISFDLAFKKFANRHGMTTAEVGRQESRTMNYKTDFPNKKREINRVRKVYGNPSKWVRWAKKQNI